MSRAFRLGITGKIGSGKSTLSDAARSEGIRVLESDVIAKEIMNSNPKLVSAIESLFGQEAYSAGVLNRSFLASKIFTDDTLRIQLEQIVHPATQEVYEAEFRKGKAGEIIALESALLFQTGLDEIFDAVILVDAKDEAVITREEESGKFNREDVVNRLKKQHYKEEWKEDADLVIANDGSREDFIRRCQSLVQLVKIVSLQELPDLPLRMIIEK
jgi:dephospho-CoA kinase